MKDDIANNFDSTRDAFRAELALYMEELASVSLSY